MRLPVTDRFSGEIPRVEPYNLPVGYAQVASNCDLVKGALRSFRQPEKIEAIGLTTCRSVYRYTENGNDHWVVSANVRHYVKSPISGEQYERVYFTGESEPRFFANDIAVAVPPDPAEFNPDTDYLILGIPAPTAAPTIDSSGGGAAFLAYVYSFVNRYGEEGPPSPIGSISNYDSGNIAIEDIESAPANRGINTVRIYRTNASAAGSAEFQFVLDATWFDEDESYGVGDWVIYEGDLYKCTTIHSGAWNGGNFTAGEDVASADLLSVFPKVNFDPPPDGLKNLMMLANGSMAGIIGNTVRMSEPFHPHAWPPEYELPVDYEIVAAANEKNIITVAGPGEPYVFHGAHPLSMYRVKGAEKLPCFNIRGICSGNSGVFYISRDGIIFTQGEGFVNITERVIDSRAWRELGYANLSLYWFEKKLFAFDSINKVGFFLEFSGELPTLNRLSLYAHAAFVGGESEFFVVADDTGAVNENDPPENMPLAVKQWDASSTNYMPYTWRSKEFVLRLPSNMSAAHLVLDADFYNAYLDLIDLEAENAAIFAGDLDAEMGVDGPLGGGFVLGGDGLLSLGTVGMAQFVSFKLYADGVLRKTKLLDRIHNRFRLPAQYLSERLFFELAGYVPVKKVSIATSMDEL